MYSFNEWRNFDPIKEYNRMGIGIAHQSYWYYIIFY